MWSFQFPGHWEAQGEVPEGCQGDDLEGEVTEGCPDDDSEGEVTKGCLNDELGICHNIMEYSTITTLLKLGAYSSFVSVVVECMCVLIL